MKATNSGQRVEQFCYSFKGVVLTLNWDEQRLSSRERIQCYETQQRRDRIAKVKAALKSTRLRKCDAVYIAASANAASDLGDSINLADLAQRRGISTDMIQQLLPNDVQLTTVTGDLEFALADNLYAGYIKTQKVAVERLRHHDTTPIPKNLDFRALDGISHEMADRLERARPLTFGEARSIPGLTPAALSTLFVNVSTSQ